MIAGATACAAIACATPIVLPWFAELELRLFDVEAKSALRAEANPDIVIIGIADDTFSALHATPPRLPRIRYAELVSLLDRAGAKTLVFDLFFDRPTSQEDDTALQQAFDRSKNLRVVLPREADVAGRDESQLSGYRVSFGDVIFHPRETHNLEIGMAYAYMPDGLWRGVYPALLDWSFDPPRPISHIVLSAYALSLGHQSSDFVISTSNHTLRLGTSTWNLGPDGELECRFLKDGQDFTFYEFSDALRMLQDPSGSLRFKNKVIFLGMATGEDRRQTPAGVRDGVKFNAEMLNGMRDSATRPLIRVSDSLLWGFSFLFALTGIWAVSPSSWSRTLAVSLGLIAILAFVPNQTLAARGLWLPTVIPGLSLLLALTAGAFVQALRTHRFVPSSYKKGLIPNREEVAVILFTDIVNSTELVRHIGDEQGREILASTLGALTKAVKRCGGEVEKTQGDGLLAVFRKHEHLDFASRSIAAIRVMQSAVSGISERAQQDYQRRVELTFGLEQGVISGRFTEAQGRMEWGLFGITIHLAARLQSECKNQGVFVLIGPTMAEALRDKITLKAAKPFAARGFENPICPFTLDQEPE